MKRVSLCSSSVLLAATLASALAQEVAERVRLRPTLLSDLDFVIQVETDSHNLPFISPWERTQHEGAVRFPDFRHFIVESGPDYERTGFVILQGCRNPNRSVELKRIDEGMRQPEPRGGPGWWTNAPLRISEG